MFLIIETGKPESALRRHGGFPHWIRVAARLPAQQMMVVDVGAGETLPAAGLLEGVFVTGSPAMVTERLPWSERTAAWLGDAVRAGTPVLGICYGHQLLAHALGGRVDDNPRGREIGTVEVQCTAEAGADPLFHGMPQAFRAQMSHSQSVLDPPPQATVLATTALDGCAAMRCGPQAWGLQFHPEFSGTHMRGYVRARAQAITREGGDARRLIEGVAATGHSRRLLRRFVQQARSSR